MLTIGIKAYPISFVQDRGFSLIRGTLPLLAVCMGIMLGAFYASFYTCTTLRAKARKNGKLEPEDRLPPMMVGAALLAIGLFWFAWTSSPAINPWPQIVSGIPIGFGVQVILLQSLAYIIDIYLVKANSAISGTVMVRSLIGGLFPLFAIGLYQRLHVSRFRISRLIRADETSMTGFLGIDPPRMLLTGACADSGGILLLRCTDQIVRQVCRQDMKQLA